MRTDEPDFEALEGAVDQLRQLIAHLRKTQAPREILLDLEHDLARWNERLAPFDYDGPYAQRALVMRIESPERDTDVPAEYFPYSPVIGPLNPIAAPIEFVFDGKEIRAEHVFDAPYNGPPTAVHGGVIALVFDELLGCLGAMRDIGGFTGTLTIRYRALTPIGKPIRMRSWIDRQEGRKTFIAGTLHHGEILCAEAEGIFIRPDVSMLQHVLRRSQSEASGNSEDSESRGD
jgi:acyl-coenzyme A thioesterase PaaI-like protein